MAERGFRLGSWQVFAIISVLAVLAIVVLVRTAPPLPPGTGSVAHGRSAGPRSAADSAVYLDSLDEAAERDLIRATMSLAEVAARGNVPVDSLAAELQLPADVSVTESMRGFLAERQLTLRDVYDARMRVQRRLGSLK